MSQCQICPEGLACTGSKVLLTQPSYVFRNPDTQLWATVPCLTGYCQQCAQTANSTADVTCCGDSRKAAAENPLCGLCADGFVGWNGACIVCNQTNGGVVFALLLLSWVYVTLFHRLSQSTS